MEKKQYLSILLCAALILTVLLMPVVSPVFAAQTEAEKAAPVDTECIQTADGIAPLAASDYEPEAVAIYAQGDTVTITADAAPTGQRFKEWSISPAVSFVDGTGLKNSTATFTMPDQAVTATAVYEAPITADFTDPNFLAAVRSTIGKPTGDIYANDVAGITTLVVEGEEIQSLAGIQHFTGLEILSCADNQLTTLDVSGLNNLEMLACYNNKLTSLNVSGLNNLTYLSCYNNELTSLDVSGLGSLVSLVCSSNKLTTLNMSGLGSLVYLKCQKNEMTVLDVSGLGSLELLHCADNRLTSLNMSGLSNLEGLNCACNQLATLDVSSLDSLAYLDCSNNQLTSLDVSGTNNLGYLDCSYNYMLGTSAVTGRSISWDGSDFIFEPQRINTVTVHNGTGSGNYVQGDTVTITADAAPTGQRFKEWSISPAVSFVDGTGLKNSTATFTMPNQAVTARAVYEAPITADFTDPNFLAAVRSTIGKPTGDIYANDVAGISVLVVEGKNIQSLAGIQHFTGLKALFCASNQLTTLDVSGLKNLEVLDCYNNKLTSLNVSGLGSLFTLMCHKNELTALDVRGLGSLELLNCANNQLTSLNVSGLSNLLLLSCPYNQLTSLDVSGLGNLGYLNCSYNYMPGTSAVTGQVISWDGRDFIFEPQSINVITLTDSATGITVSGNISEGAVLTVTDLALGNSAADNAIRERMQDDDYVFILGRNISLSGSFTGMLTLSLPVDAQYNGQAVTILHAKQDGTLETYTVKVQDGKATFDVTGLSPFAVFKKDSLDNIPKVGDTGTALMWWLLLAISVAGIITIVLVRKGNS